MSKCEAQARADQKKPGVEGVLKSDVVPTTSLVSPPLDALFKERELARGGSDPESAFFA